MRCEPFSQCYTPCVTEFRDRAQRIDQLKKRYEILMSTLTPAGEDEPKSQAYYVIKAAQEREELQRQVCLYVCLFFCLHIHAQMRFF